MITIPNLSLKTKKYLLCIFLIVQILVFMWRQRVYSRFVMSIVPSPFVSLMLISSQFLILVSKHVYTWQKLQGWWSVVWDGKKWGFLHLLICSYAHLFTFIFMWTFIHFSIPWLMPKISKENFAGDLVDFCSWVTVVPKQPDLLDLPTYRLVLLKATEYGWEVALSYF